MTDSPNEPGGVRLAYADPPYIGQAKRHYSHDPNCAEVDHEELIGRLVEYDGWALSLSSPTLKTILPMCPEDVRVMAWVKPFAAYKANVSPAYAWEPIIVSAARKADTAVPDVVARDFISANITMKKGLHGAKPVEFCRWLFVVMGGMSGDSLDDLYPGTGIVGREWQRYCVGPLQMVLP